jgi:hypothetical protein
VLRESDPETRQAAINGLRVALRWRDVTYRLTTFPTPRDAQAAYRGDVAVMRTWCHVEQRGAQAGCASGWSTGHPSSTFTAERLYKNFVFNAYVESRNSGPLEVVQATVDRDEETGLCGYLLTHDTSFLVPYT